MQRQTNRAYSMVEICIVVVILMIGIIPIYDAMVSGSKRTRFNRRRNFAASICNNAVEVFKKMHIKALVERSDEIKELVMPNPSDPKQPIGEDTIMCPWKNEQVTAYAEQDTEFKQLLEDYSAEYNRYKVLTRITPTSKQGMVNNLCSFQVKVVYRDLINKDKVEKTVAAGMVFSDASFPAGKAVPQ